MDLEKFKQAYRSNEVVSIMNPRIEKFEYNKVVITFTMGAQWTYKTNDIVTNLPISASTDIMAMLADKHVQSVKTSKVKRNQKEIHDMLVLAEFPPNELEFLKKWTKKNVKKFGMRDIKLSLQNLCYRRTNGMKFIHLKRDRDRYKKTSEYYVYTTDAYNDIVDKFFDEFYADASKLAKQTSRTLNKKSKTNKSKPLGMVSLEDQLDDISKQLFG